MGGNYVKGLFFLFGLFVISGFLELFGIAMIFPVMLILTSPDSSQSVAILNFLQGFFPNLSAIKGAMVLSFAMIAVFMFKDVFLIFCAFLQNRFTMHWSLYINRLLVNKMLYAPYIQTKDISYGAKHTFLFSISKEIALGFVLKTLTLFANLVVATCIVAFLFWKFFIPALLSISFMGVFVYFENAFFKKKAREFGEKGINYTNALSDDVNFIIKSLKEIGTSNKQEYFSDYIMNYSTKIMETSALENAYSACPLFVTEIGILTAFLIMLTSVVFLGDKTGSSIVSSLAVIALIVLRLTPQINKILSSMYSINVQKPKIIWFLEQYEKISKFNSECTKDLPKMDFNEEIVLKNASFDYGNNEGIFDINLTIKKGEFIGIIGSSGAGKTTLADVISGVYPINCGEFYVDENLITPENSLSWRKNISFLPQEVVFLKGSVAKNVAWGIKEEDIDRKKVAEALKLAAVYDEIKDIDSEEDFSVGQKHRIALARIHYQGNNVIILDEATSSLDVKSENAVSENIASLKGQKTIIAIAHRLQTLKKCDRIVYLDKGRIIDTGTFPELRSKYPDIDKMLKISSFD